MPISTSLRGDLLAHQLRTAECEVVVTTAQWAARFDEIAAAVPTLRAVVTIDDEAAGGDGLHRHRFADLVATPGAPPHVEVSVFDPAVVLFTSGTTGPSKGALRSHRGQHGARRDRHRPDGLRAR